MVASTGRARLPPPWGAHFNPQEVLREKGDSRNSLSSVDTSFIKFLVCFCCCCCCPSCSARIRNPQMILFLRYVVTPPPFSRKPLARGVQPRLAGIDPAPTRARSREVRPWPVYPEEARSLAPKASQAWEEKRITTVAHDIYPAPCVGLHHDAPPHHQSMQVAQTSPLLSISVGDGVGAKGQAMLFAAAVLLSSGTMRIASPVISSANTSSQVLCCVQWAWPWGRVLAKQQGADSNDP